MRNLNLLIISIGIFFGSCCDSNKECCGSDKKKNPDLVKGADDWITPLNNISELIYINEDLVKDTLKLFRTSDSEFCGGGDECYLKCDYKSIAFTSALTDSLALIVKVAYNNKLVFNSLGYGGGYLAEFELPNLTHGTYTNLNIQVDTNAQTISIEDLTKTKHYSFYKYNKYKGLLEYTDKKGGHWKLME